MDTEKKQRPQARSDVKAQEIGEEVMLHDAQADKIHVLNHSAYAIWKLCNGDNTLEDICRKLSELYPDASGDIREDIQAVIEDFRQKLLLI